MQNLKQYLASNGITLGDIEKSTNLPSEMISGLINGDVNIMEASLESVLLLTQYLKIPLSDVVSSCFAQQNNWQITTDNDDWYILIFMFGEKEIRIRMAPVSLTTTKYIRVIAAFHYQLFIDGIIDAKRGQISVYRKQVDFELQKLDFSDTFIQLIDNDTLEELLDAGRTPGEAAAELAAKEDGF